MKIIEKIDKNKGFFLDGDFFKRQKSEKIVNIFYALNEALVVMFLDEKMNKIRTKKAEFFPIYTEDVPVGTRFILMNGRADLLERGDGILVSFFDNGTEITLSFCGELSMGENYFSFQWEDCSGKQSTIIGLV